MDRNKLFFKHFDFWLGPCTFYRFLGRDVW